MKIIALRPFSGPHGAPFVGQTLDVPDDAAEALVAANYAKPAEDDDAPKKARRSKAKAAPKVETATEPEVETAADDAAEVETAEAETATEE